MRCTFNNFNKHYLGEAIAITSFSEAGQLKFEQCTITVKEINWMDLLSTLVSYQVRNSLVLLTSIIQQVSILCKKYSLVLASAIVFPH